MVKTTNIIKPLVHFMNKNEDLSKFVYYLDRHIEVDGEEHGPMALNMINELCGDDEKKWSEANDVCIKAMQMRIKLWDCLFLLKSL